MKFSVEYMHLLSDRFKSIKSKRWISDCSSTLSYDGGFCIKWDQFGFFMSCDCKSQPHCHIRSDVEPFGKICGCCSWMSGFIVKSTWQFESSYLCLYTPFFLIKSFTGIILYSLILMVMMLQPGLLKQLLRQLFPWNGTCFYCQWLQCCD